jgi:hypothetical protein
LTRGETGESYSRRLRDFQTSSRFWQHSVFTSYRSSARVRKQKTLKILHFVWWNYHTNTVFNPVPPRQSDILVDKIVACLIVWLTLNIIFCMCNIWVILRRNVIYLYNKKPHLDQLFHCQSSRYDVIWWIFGTKKKTKEN